MLATTSSSSFPFLFFKRLSDVWDEEYRNALEETKEASYAQATADDRFAIPDGAHWNDVRTTSHDVGRALLNAFRAIERRESRASVRCVWECVVD